MQKIIIEIEGEGVRCVMEPKAPEFEGNNMVRHMLDGKLNEDQVLALLLMKVLGVAMHKVPFTMGLLVGSVDDLSSGKYQTVEFNQDGMNSLLGWFSGRFPTSMEEGEVFATLEDNRESFMQQMAEDFDSRMAGPPAGRC